MGHCAVAGSDGRNEREKQLLGEKVKFTYPQEPRDRALRPEGRMGVYILPCLDNCAVVTSLAHWKLVEKWPCG